MKPILTVEHIEKIYRIGSLHNYYTLRDGLRNLFHIHKNKKEYVKALDDISFEINAGEKVGIIGRNGAGKSTLLKILSRITLPTKGRAILRGKVASLLEVGTGFHGELTGRENIYFNGAILGMKRTEIKRKLDEIVAFAGVEKFLDTPVKHYSSGMQLRLAFAVAAHLDADILLIDEVLAVGDAEFQKKSMGKMDEVSKSGRTILFVSHNMNAIEQFCSSTIYLEKGKIKLFDKTHFVIEKYLSEFAQEVHVKSWENVGGYGDDVVRLINVSLCNEQNEKKYFYDRSEKINIIVHFTLLKKIETYLNLHVYSINNEKLMVLVQDKNEIPTETGQYTIKAEIPSHLFNSGKYYIGVAFTTYSPYKVNLFDEQCVFFEITEDMSLRNHPFKTRLPGYFLPEVNFELIK
ncbi:MAG: ABC transporter ATP-binding protein [Bacteroidales bacterium]|nr:ABC transporter ATP-binding protein [Bacteroidales bacterium]